MSQPPLFHTPGAPPRNRTAGSPQWLQDALQARRPHPRNTWWNHCRHCGRLILTGDDADHMALVVRVDPNPLTHQQHMQAVLDRTLIYLAAPTPTPHTWRLYRLGPGHLWHQLANPLLLPPHDCHHPPRGPSLADTPDPTPPDPNATLPF
ncbi:hypothetical protein [Micrococcus sp.]|uniref:hypothetical protein n=1 Tax=Micrococcus sp. TaxID=1271 RepID=UPI002A91A2E1|nr:hypothetical protein [Micrococcus sp.]MDY6054359.1 hypothetical protein [Micrococcus sp.]